MWLEQGQEGGDRGEEGEVVGGFGPHIGAGHGTGFIPRALGSLVGFIV